MQDGKGSDSDGEESELPTRAVDEERGKRRCEREQEEDQEWEDSEKSVVHYYAGQTLRNVVLRCKDHCRSAKMLLEKAPKYATFRDFDEATNVKKVSQSSLHH